MFVGVSPPVKGGFKIRGIHGCLKGNANNFVSLGSFEVNFCKLCPEKLSLWAYLMTQVSFKVTYGGPILVKKLVKRANTASKPEFQAKIAIFK